jgi:SAM-dependent methyltransferase
MPNLAQHYTDPRLTVLYDLENTTRADFDFYLSLAAELNAQTIIDLGCGTGTLAIELSSPGRRVIGVDPSPAMLTIARRKQGAERVTWIEGGSNNLGTPNADLVIMTGNVAQVFLDDAEWSANLRNICNALRPGGYLAFESRSPDARAWEGWNLEDTYEEFESPNGPMASWLEVVGVENGRVHMLGHNVFKATGEVVTASDTLRFRTYSELTNSLGGAGFIVERVYGDWHRGPFTASSRTMIFIARNS